MIKFINDRLWLRVVIGLIVFATFWNLVMKPLIRSGIEPQQNEKIERDEDD
ncbi:hypothetical protein [Chroococcidiopsis sp.]|uniref:hypothetical protein n=1 Tax=Chroococcidiopsis sp. TaxID=3088168 RepID=UPI003F2A0882